MMLMLCVTIPRDPTTARAEMVLLEMDRHARVKLIKLFSTDSGRRNSEMCFRSTKILN